MKPDDLLSDFLLSDFLKSLVLGDPIVCLLLSRRALLLLPVPF